MTARLHDLVDPAWGMTVDIAKAEAAGLLVEVTVGPMHSVGPAAAERCIEEPAVHVDRAAAVTRAWSPRPNKALRPTDEGMRWYAICSCGLSEAHPGIKARLDDERAAAASPQGSAGICELAEAGG